MYSISQILPSSGRKNVRQHVVKTRSLLFTCQLTWDHHYLIILFLKLIPSSSITVIGLHFLCLRRNMTIGNMTKSPEVIIRSTNDLHLWTNCTLQVNSSCCLEGIFLEHNQGIFTQFTDCMQPPLCYRGRVKQLQ